MIYLFNELDNKKKTAELEKLYNERIEDYRTSQEKVNRLDATIAVNTEKFLELYNSLNPTLVRNYGLELAKDIKDMTETEIQEYKEKIQTVFNSIYTKLGKYLRTGQVDEVEDILMSVVSSNAEQQTEHQQPNTTLTQTSLTEQNSEELKMVSGGDQVDLEIFGR